MVRAKDDTGDQQNLKTSAGPDKSKEKASGSLAGAHAKKTKSSVIVLRVVLVVLILLAAAGIAYLVYTQVQMNNALEQQESNPVPETETEQLADNPIDFQSLKAENNDIYAWIYVPNTKVNMPVLQRVGDDNYYLDHDQDGNSSVAGAIFTQSMNSTDFTDPVTVIYGHNMKNDGMFASLHYFEDPDFFNDNDTFYIYTQNKILTYTIVSAYKYDNRHIMNSFDFSDPQVRQSYFDFVTNPESMVVNKRAGIQLNQDSKIVQLSTCIGDDNSRYLVTGVLTDEQATN